MAKQELKALLHLERPKKDNPTHLHRFEYEIVSCTYSFDKDFNAKREILSGAKAGIIQITLATVPTDEIMKWAFDSKCYYNGEITMFENVKGGNEGRLEFMEARCIHCDVVFDMNDTNAFLLKLSIVSPHMIIGNTEYKISTK